MALAWDSLADDTVWMEFPPSRAGSFCIRNYVQEVANMARDFSSISRRSFLANAGVAAAGFTVLPGSAIAASRHSLREWLLSPAFDDFVRARLAASFVPGASLAIVYDGQLLRTAGYGWANIAASRAMQADTLINIASVTKTITCTAVMQLHEQGRFRLDDEVSRYLPFAISNPSHPDAPITIRHLLTHTSTIEDGPAYEASYACGDPLRPLGDWLRDYLVVGGPLYDPTTNFSAHKPGKQWSYSNIAFGVLGLLVESVSGVPYMDYCISNIFRPLGMANSRFLLAGMPANVHATPYTYIEDGNVSAVPLRDPTWTPPPGQLDLQVPHCLYSFATPPDGLARTSAAELSRFMLAYMQCGKLDGYQLLRRETVAQILSDQHVQLPEPVKRHSQGLAWVATGDRSKRLWEHTGGDPGVSTLMGFRPADQRGLVVLSNSSSFDPWEAIGQAVFGNRPPT
jgi:CubicO group peptidase (beta-lactamase class C family)